jgi:hypothetical protein
MTSDVDTIALGAAALLDAALDLEAGPYWSILSDWLFSVAARAEAGDADIDHDFAVAFTRALMAEEEA